MHKSLKVHFVTPDEAANLVEKIAERIRGGEGSFELQLPISQVQITLIKLDCLEGLKLLNRIALLLLSKGGKSSYGQYFTEKRLEGLKPLDPIADSKALQTLANEIRSKNGLF